MSERRDRLTNMLERFFELRYAPLIIAIAKIGLFHIFWGSIFKGIEDADHWTFVDSVSVSNAA